MLRFGSVALCRFFQGQSLRTSFYTFDKSSRRLASVSFDVEAKPVAPNFASDQSTLHSSVDNESDLVKQEVDSAKSIISGPQDQVEEISASQSLALGKAALQLLRDVSARLAEKGSNLILTNNSETHFESQAYCERLPTFVLLKYQIPRSKILEFFLDCPEMLETDAVQLEAYLRRVFNLGFRADEALYILQMFGKNALAKSSPAFANITDVMMTLGRLGITSDTLYDILRRHPELLTLTSKQILDVCGNLRALFSEKQMRYILRHHPSVLFKGTGDFEAKFKYLQDVMGAKPEQINKSQWYARTLEFIQVRHEFMARTGAYIKPNPKRPMATVANPKIVDIIDSSDREVAELAGVTYAEFVVFKEMFKRQLADEESGRNLTAVYDNLGNEVKPRDDVEGSSDSDSDDCSDR